MEAEPIMVPMTWSKLGTVTVLEQRCGEPLKRGTKGDLKISVDKENKTTASKEWRKQQNKIGDCRYLNTLIGKETASLATVSQSMRTKWRIVFVHMLVAGVLPVQNAEK